MNQQTDRLNTALAGRYRIERRLGEGGMATVYLCEDVKHKRKVALKLLKPELAAVLGAERFVQEITTTAALQHPHILPLFDSGTADGFLFYVMPYIEGETLREKLNRETQLGVDEAVRIARDIADALDYAHRHGVIHRDIKPENILLHDGRPMVADFGIALAVSAAAGGRMTETGLSLGTPHYMSPEQATGAKEITARSDIYSLGSVLYESLAGEPPHSGGSAQQVVMKIIAERVQPVTELRKSVPLNVAAAVAKSLEKLPADRFESAKAFGDALGNPAFTSAAFLDAIPAPALARRGRRRETILAVAFVTALAGWLWSALESRRAAAPVAVHFAFSTSPSQPIGTALGRTLALSPDGRTVVYATADSAGRNRLFSRALDDLRQLPMAGTEDALFPFFSPDGLWVAFFDGRQLKKVPLDGGPPTQIADVQGLQGATWGTDGIVVSTGGKLALVPSGGGVLAPLSRGDSTQGYWPVVLPGGKTVAYATKLGQNAELAVADISTGRVTKLGVPGTFPLGVVGGELIFSRADGAVMAAAFDARAIRMAPNARVVVSEALQNAAIGESKAAVSANGSLAYVSGSGMVQAVSVDMRGTARPIAVPQDRLTDPRFSPDGRRILADVVSGGRTDIWIYDVASGAPRRVTTEGTLNNRPDWSPDGARILYRSNRGGDATSIWWQPADGSGKAEQLVAWPGKELWEGVLTPDGQTVVFRTGTIGTADIWYRRVTGDTAVHGIATTPATEYAPRVSPDGRWIAYSSDESRIYQVYVRPFPGPGAQFPVSVGGGNTPVWSRDGRRIFYYVGNQIVAASVNTTPTFSVTARDILFSGDYFLNGGHANFDVSPDGKSFLMLRTLSASREEIIVIPDWKAELRAGVKRASQP